MAEKFNPYRAGQPLSGTGNPNTGVWQRTWEDGGPGRDSFGGPQTPGGVADWSGDPWKPEAPGVMKGIAASQNSPSNNALLYGAAYGVSNNAGDPTGPDLPSPNTNKKTVTEPLAVGPGKATLALGPGNATLGQGTDNATPALNKAPNTGRSKTTTVKKAENSPEYLPTRSPNRRTIVKKVDDGRINVKGAVEATATDGTSKPKDQVAAVRTAGALMPGNAGEGLTGPQMAFQQTVNRSREHAQRYDQLRTHDVPSHESIQQGVKDSRRWHEDAAQGAKSTSSPKSGKRMKAGANLGAFYNLQEDRKNNVQ